MATLVRDEYPIRTIPRFIPHHEPTGHVTFRNEEASPHEPRICTANHSKCSSCGLDEDGRLAVVQKSPKSRAGFASLEGELVHAIPPRSHSFSVRTGGSSSMRNAPFHLYTLRRARTRLCTALLLSQASRPGNIHTRTRHIHTPDAMATKTQPIVVPINEPKPGVGGYQSLNPRSEVLPAGWNGFNSKPLSCDIQVDHDVAVTMRDGAKLYVDVYRPPGSEQGAPVPAILCWSPFGKKFNGVMSLKLMTPWNLGIPDGTLSGLEKFEAPDPADWVARGYAIVNVDARGTGDSDGVMAVLGAQEAEDGYDTVEAVAALPWCTGDVGMAGNSHLAIAQWFIAALRPPHLKAIAPWEGCGDLYREQFGRGGIYNGDLFDKLIVKYMLAGRHGMESPREMWKASPLANDWWNAKRPDMKQINIPTYITGTWTNTMHGMGAIRGWLEVDSPHKWLRWHPWQEWYDLWGNGQAKEELLQFFDHFLRGVDNGWEKTPRVRMAVLKFGTEPPLENVVEDDFPLPRTEYKKLYLQADGRLGPSAPAAPGGVATYDSESDATLGFTHVFAERTRLVGLPKAELYMSCAAADDWDVYVQLEKLDARGAPMLNLNIPWQNLPVRRFDDMKPEERTEVVLYRGPLGILRASHRATDPARSIHPHWPYHPHDREDKIAPGTVIRLDVGIWAMGVEYAAGEALRVTIGGRSPAINNFGSPEHSLNRGEHRVHFGGDTPSCVVLPFV